VSTNHSSNSSHSRGVVWYPEKDNANTQRQNLTGLTQKNKATNV